MRLQTRHTTRRFISISLFSVLCAMGAGCAGSDEEDSMLPGASAPSVTVAQAAYRDIDEDGDMDLFFTTRSDDAFVSTRLLNQGAGHFTVQQSPATATATPGGAIDLRLPDEWDAASAEGPIAELEGDLVGLSQVLEMLTVDRREALGVDNRGRARGYYDCAANYACGFQHANWGGAWISVQEGANVANLGAWNDHITSIRNRSARCWVDWWEHADYSGDHYGQSPGNDNPNVGDYWNDKFSAVHWGLGC